MFGKILGGGIVYTTKERQPAHVLHNMCVNPVKPAGSVHMVISIFLLSSIMISVVAAAMDLMDSIKLICLGNTVKIVAASRCPLIFLARLLPDLQPEPQQPNYMKSSSLEHFLISTVSLPKIKYLFSLRYSYIAGTTAKKPKPLAAAAHT